MAKGRFPDRRPSKFLGSVLVESGLIEENLIFDGDFTDHLTVFLAIHEFFTGISLKLNFTNFFSCVFHFIEVLVKGWYLFNESLSLKGTFKGAHGVGTVFFKKSLNLSFCGFLFLNLLD